MKLLLDIGNSRLKWGYWAGGALVATGQAPHGGQSPDILLGPALAESIEPEEIRIANVAGPAIGQAIASCLYARFRMAPRFACSSGAAVGLTNGYTEPAQLGVDRWLAICAAWADRPGSLAVIDAGTATTIDLIRADGRHAGGLILPGLVMMESALQRETGSLARLARKIPPSPGLTPGSASRVSPLLARDTATAIRMGPLQATCALVQACVGLFTPAAYRLVLTGGDAPELQAGLKAAGLAPELRPHLVLEGLALEPGDFVPADSATPWVG